MAVFTVFMAASSLFVHENTLLSFGETRRAAFVLLVIEVVAGAAILVILVEMAGLAAWPAGRTPSRFTCVAATAGVASLGDPGGNWTFVTVRAAVRFADIAADRCQYSISAARAEALLVEPAGSGQTTVQLKTLQSSKLRQLRADSIQADGGEFDAQLKLCGLD
ncbi:MAG: hypothetical protein ACU0BO_07630 [Limimaricola soesokkakensis]